MRVDYHSGLGAGCHEMSQLQPPLPLRERGFLAGLMKSEEDPLIYPVANNMANSGAAPRRYGGTERCICVYFGASTANGVRGAPLERGGVESGKMLACQSGGIVAVGAEYGGRRCGGGVIQQQVQLVQIHRGDTIIERDAA